MFLIRCSSAFAHRASTNTCEECSSLSINTSFFLVIGVMIVLLVMLIVAKVKLRQVKEAYPRKDWASLLLIGMGFVKVSPGDSSSLAYLHTVNELKIRIFAHLKVYFSVDYFFTSAEYAVLMLGS